MIKKIFKAFRFAWYWNKALNAATKKQYKSALEYVERMEALFSYVPNPHVLKTYLLYILQRDKDCILAAEKAVDVITRSHEYSGENQKYLLCYVLTWAKAAAVNAKCTSDIDITVNVEELDLNRVQAHVKRNFPLRHHPQWVESS